MFLKDDLSNKKVWSNYSKSNEENYNEKLQQQQQRKQQQPNRTHCNSELLYMNTGCVQKSMESIVQENVKKQDSIPQLGGQRLNLQPNVRMQHRCLSDRVWRAMSDNEITARGDGWNRADLGSLQKVYDNFNSICLGEQRVSSELYNQCLDSAKIFRISSKPSSTLCNAIKQIITRDSTNTVSKASPSAASTVYGVIQTSSEDSIYAAHSGLDFVTKDSKNYNEYSKSWDLEFRPIENCGNFQRNFTLESNSKDTCSLKNSETSILSSSNDASSNVTPNLSNMSVGMPDINCYGNTFDINCQASSSNSPVIATQNSAMNFQSETFTPTWPSVQLSSSSSSSMPFKPAISLWQEACANAAYNNFMNIQWSTAAHPFGVNGTTTVPAIGGSPMLPYINWMNLLLTNPNTFNVATQSFYNNITLCSILQQQLLLQRQQLLIASGILFQQQSTQQHHQPADEQHEKLQQQQPQQQQLPPQQQQQRQQQLQQQNQQPQQQIKQQRQNQYNSGTRRRQNHTRNSRIRRPSQYNIQNKINSHNNNSNNSNSNLNINRNQSSIQNPTSYQNQKP